MSRRQTATRRVSATKRSAVRTEVSHAPKYYRVRSARVAAVQWRGDNLDEFRAVFGSGFSIPPCPLSYWLVQFGNQQPSIYSPEIFERSFEEIPA